MARTKVFKPNVKKFYEEIYLDSNSLFNKFRVGVKKGDVAFSGPFEELSSQQRNDLERLMKRYKQFLPTFKKIQKDGLIDLKEAGELIGLPEKVNEKGRVTGGLRMRVVEAATRKNRPTPTATKFFNNVLKKKLKLQKIDVGQGQPTYFIKKPNAQEIDVLKDYYLVSGGTKGGLTDEIVSLVEDFHNNPKYKKFTNKGLVIPQELLPKNLTISQAAYAQHKLAQIYNGKKFPNTDIKIPTNKTAAKKYYETVSKMAYQNPYRMAQIKDAMDTITEELGKNYFTIDDKQTNMDTLRRKIKKLFLKEKIPFYDKKSKNPFGVNINEIVGITATSRVPGAAPYSQFVNLLEGKVNQVDYALFQRTFENYLNRVTDEIAKGDNGNPLKVIREYNKFTKGYINKISDPAARQTIKEIGFPTLSLQSPEKIYGAKRIKQLSELGLDLPGAYEKMGFTIGVPKDTATLKEVAMNPKIFIDQAKKVLINQVAKNPSKSCELILNKATGGIATTCLEAIDKDLVGSAEKLSEMEAKSGPLEEIQKTSKRIVDFVKTGQITTADKLPRPDDAVLKDTFKETNLRWNNDIGAFVTPDEDIASQADLKKYAADNPMEVKAGEEPVKAATNKSVLANVGKAMARVGAPLPTAALDAYFIGQQVKEGKGTAEIASNPLNWLGLATMEPLTKISGVAEGGGLNKALRLGLNPATIRGISRFAGLPGLAVSTAMTAYDQYQKYKDGEGFIFNLLNQKGTE